jgi:hypothetical protein
MDSARRIVAPRLSFLLSESVFVFGFFDGQATADYDSNTWERGFTLMWADLGGSHYRLGGFGLRKNVDRCARLRIRPIRTNPRNPRPQMLGRPRRTGTRHA